MMQNGRTIVINNPAGGDSCSLLEKLLLQAQKQKHTCAVVELPCLGIPRIAYRMGIDRLEAMQTIDQVLIDYDRGMLKDIHSYLYSQNGWDGLLMQPQARPDTPTIIKLQQEQTLQHIPGLLKAHLSGYHYIFMLTQGQLVHPMTFFAIREADFTVLVMNEPVDLIRTYATFKTLRQDYGVEKIEMYSEKINKDFTEQTVLHQVADLFRVWGG